MLVCVLLLLADMKKFYFIVSLLSILLFCLLIIKPENIYATIIDSREVIPVNGQLPSGQSHYYSVFFRGNGEAVVNFRTQFRNNRDNNLSTLTYFFSDKSNYNNLVIYQKVNDYNYPCYPSYGTPEPIGLDYETDSKIPLISTLPTPTPAVNDITHPETTIAPCLDQSTYYGGGSIYLEADFQISDNTLRIVLPRVVSASESVNLIITYRSSNYTDINFPGSFTYSFDTLRSNDIVDNIQIGISVEEDYVLKGAKGQVRYTKSVLEFMPPSVSSGTDLYSKEFDRFYNHIGQGTIYKYASHLAPMESYIVEGSYADSFWKLYAKRIVLGLLIFIVIILVIMIVLKKIVIYIRNTDGKKEVDNNSFLRNLNENQKSLLISSLASMAGATLVVIYTLFLFFFFTIIDNYIKFYNGVDIIVIILIFVLSLVLYSAFVFLPSIMIAFRRNAIWGIVTFVLTASWLLLYLMLVLIFGFILSNRMDIMDYSVGSGRVPAVTHDGS